MVGWDVYGYSIGSEPAAELGRHQIIIGGFLLGEGDLTFIRLKLSGLHCSGHMLCCITLEGCC